MEKWQSLLGNLLRDNNMDIKGGNSVQYVKGKKGLQYNGYFGRDHKYKRVLIIRYTAGVLWEKYIFSI